MPTILPLVQDPNTGSKLVATKAFIEEKLTDVDPREFGVVFDAVYDAATQTWTGTDNTVAWASLVTSLGSIGNTALSGGARIVCPVGASMSDGGHILPHRVVVQGGGHGSQLVCTGDQQGFFTITGRYQYLRDLHFIAGGKGMGANRPMCLRTERLARGGFSDCVFTQPHHDQHAIFWDENGVGAGIFSANFRSLLFHHDDPNAYPAAGDGVGITAATWEHYGERANFNANSMRDVDFFTGGGVVPIGGAAATGDLAPCMNFGSTTTGIHNNVFDRILGELCTGGILHVAGIGSSEFRNISLQDTAGKTINAPTLKLMDGALKGSNQNVIVGYDRRDGTMVAGVPDIEVSASSKDNTFIAVGERANQRIEIHLNGSSATFNNRLHTGNTPTDGVFVSGAENSVFIENGSIWRGTDTDNLVDELSVGVSVKSVLAADVTKNSDLDNNTAASTDPLTVALDPGVYEIEAELFYNTSITADFASRLYAVGGTTSQENIAAEGLVNNDAEGITGQVTRVVGLATELGVSGTSGGGDAWASYKGRLTVDTATTLSLRWAQRVSDASDTILRSGSFLRATPVT